MRKLEEIRIEVIELENIVAIQEELIEQYEDEIIQSGKERSYGDYQNLGRLYKDLGDNKERLNYIRRFV